MPSPRSSCFGSSIWNRIFPAAADDPHALQPAQPPHLRFIARRDRERVADRVARGREPGAVHHQFVRRRDVAPLGQDVVPLHRRIEPEQEGADHRVGARALDEALGAEDRRDARDVGIGLQCRDERRRAADGRLGVERHRAARREPQLVARLLDEAAEALAHPRAEHVHVEQHRGGDRHAGGRERGARATARERRESETEHHRPTSSNGAVRTRRCAARNPLTTPSTSESPTAKATIPGVTIAKRSGVA